MEVLLNDTEEHGRKPENWNLCTPPPDVQLHTMTPMCYPHNCQTAQAAIVLAMTPKCMSFRGAEAKLPPFKKQLSNGRRSWQDVSVIWMQVHEMFAKVFNWDIFKE